MRKNAAVDVSDGSRRKVKKQGERCTEYCGQQKLDTQKMNVGHFGRGPSITNGMHSGIQKHVTY